jgi:hypothetical protein
MTDLDAPLVKHILHISQRQWEADVEHHRQADDFRAHLKVPERGVLSHLQASWPHGPATRKVLLTTPACAKSPATLPSLIGFRLPEVTEKGKLQ